MARLSDMIRRGETVLNRDEQGPATPDLEATRQGDPGQERADADGVEFRSLPPAQDPPPVKMRDFPILSQIYNEVGTVATVVEQINQISAFIQAFAGGEGFSLKDFAAMGAHAEASPASPPEEKAPPPETRMAAPPPAPSQAQPRTTPEVPPPPQPEPPQPQVVEPTVPEEVSEEEIEVLYGQLYTFVEGVTQAVQAGNPFDVGQAFVLISRVVDTPRATDILYRRAIYTREAEDTHAFASTVVLHTVNVAVYALKIGEGLGYSRDQLIDLGAAALVHDVGMVTLPIDLLTKGQFDKSDVARLHQHPIQGHAILSQLGDKYKWLAEIALQEHEREDGSGYPHGIKGPQIHQYAKIVGVADTYAGYTRSRGDRRGRLPFEAVKEIIQNMKQKFDSRVVRVLLSKLSAFPIGSLVKLNSGAIGMVVETDEAYPLRPAIRILYDAQGRQVSEERDIQLREYPILHITDAVLKEDLQRA